MDGSCDQAREIRARRELFSTGKILKRKRTVMVRVGEGVAEGVRQRPTR